MVKSRWLAAALISALGATVWWFVAPPRSSESLVGAEGEASPEEDAPSAEAALLRASPGAMDGRGAGRGAAPPYEIVVHVFDAKGRPVPDVAVTARCVDSVRDPEDASQWGGAVADDRVRKAITAIDDPRGADDAQRSRLRTDSHGATRVSVLQPGNYEILALPVAGLVGNKASASPTRDKPVASVSIRMMVGSALTGRVVDARERGVESSISGQWETADFTGWNQLRIPTVASDARGDFSFAAVPDGKGRLTVHVAARGSFTGYVVPTPSRGDVTLTIPAGGSVLGRILDSAGQPVPGADVTVSTSSIEPTPPFTARGGVARGKAGADGAYRIDGVVPGRVTAVSVAAAGFMSLAQAVGSAPWSGAVVATGEDLTLDLTLSRGAAVRGRVLDRGSKGAEVPVTDAEVFLLGQNSGTTGAMVPRVSNVDADGAFRFEDVPLGKHVVYARSPSHYLPVKSNGMPVGLNGPSKASGGDGSTSTMLVLTKEGETLEKTIWMTKGVPVSGLVRGPDRAPVAGALIRTRPDAFFQNGWQYGVRAQGLQTLAISAADGRFTIPGLAPRADWTLAAYKAPFAPKWCQAFKVAAGDPVADVVLELEVGGSIAGRVVEADGRAAVGVSISAWSQQGGSSDSNVSGSDGTFRLEGLGAGGQQLQAYSPAGEHAGLALNPPLKAGEAREGVEVKLVAKPKSTLKLSGVVVDADGVPVGERSVNANGANGTNMWVQTDGDGTFTFRGLAEGKATLSVQHLPGDSGFTNEPMPKESFDVPSEGARLVLPRRTATTIVSGRVLGPDGSLVPLCSVSAVGTAKQAASSPASGAFNVGGEAIGGEFRREVPAGVAFEISVNSPRDAEGKPLSYRPKRISVTDVKGPLEIRLESGKLIRGRVISPDGAGIAGTTVGYGAGTETTDVDGSFEFLGLDQDEVRLTVQAVSRYTPPSQPTVARAGATDVVIRMEAALAIAGRVVDALGNPVSNGSVQVAPSGGDRRNWNGSNGNANLTGAGTFRVENLPKGGLYDISLQIWGQPGRVANYKPWATTGVKAGTEDLIVRLEPGEVIEGVVVDVEGRPVKDTWVGATSVVGGVSSQGGNSDEAGRFAIGGLDPGLHVLRANQWNGTNRTSLPVRAETGAKGVRVVMPNQARLSGRVLVDGDKSGFDVSARPTGPVVGDTWPQIAQGQTTADGSFAFEVPADVYLDVQVSKGGDDRFGHVARVRGGDADVSIPLDQGRSIEGAIEAADGSPATGSMWVMAASATWFGWGYVDVNGKFRVRALPGGTYHLRVVMNGRPNAKPALVDAVAGATGVLIRMPP